MTGELIPINLAQESYQSRSSLSSCMKLYNLYAENTNAASPFKLPAIFNSPNPKEWLDLGIFNEVYGQIQMNEFLYVVCGVRLYKINTSKVVTLVGTMGVAPNIVQMTENGIQVTILTSSGISYYYDEDTDTFAQITDPNYFLASSVCTINGYTIFSRRETGQFFMSDLRDTTTYPALYIATAESLSDNIVRVAAFNSQLYIFGERSLEIWQNTGVGDPPFERINGANIQRGSAATLSVAISAFGIVWLGDDKIVYATTSYSPERISTFGIENIIEEMESVSDANCFMYTQGGHIFYVMNFPTDQRTLVYDVTTKLWSERGSFNNGATMQTNWACSLAARFDNLVIVNGRTAGRLYYLDLNTYDEDGQEVLAEIVTSLTYKDYNQFSISNLVIVMDSGVGLEYPDQGYDPKVMFSFSIDGGKTWIDRADASIGKIGKYRQRINWTNLGSAREFIFRFRVSDPVKRSFLGAYVQIIDGGF